MELAALPGGEEDTKTAVKMFSMRVGPGHEMALSWVKRVCEVAGGSSIGVQSALMCFWRDKFRCHRNASLSRENENNDDIYQARVAVVVRSTS